MMRTMRFNNAARHLLAITVLALATQSGHAAIINPISLTPTGTVRGDGPWMIGYDFTVGGSNITIDSIGVEDILNGNPAGAKSYGDGTFSATQVGIWNAAGTLLGSATIKSATASPLINGFRYERLSSSVTLLAGQTYTIGAQKGAGVDFFYDGHPTANYAAGSGITLGADRVNGTATFAKPVSDGGGVNGRWSGGNATSVNSAPIATPALFSWAGVGTTLAQRNDFTGTVGYAFTTGSNDRLAVTALGFFDHNLDGLASSHQVGIWDATGTTLLATATVAAGTASTAYEFFRYAQLSTELLLDANTTYLIAASVTNGGDIWYNNNVAADFNPSTNPLYSGFLVDNFGRYSASAFGAPTTSASPTSHYFLAPNFLVVLVPAPAALPAGLGLLTLTMLRRRRGA